MDLQQVRTVRNVIPPEKPWAIPVTKVRKDTRAFAKPSFYSTTQRTKRPQRYLGSRQ